jgi:hypothetical protein
MTDLNSLLPSGSGWELGSARFINDSGRIVGLGTNDGAQQWFVLDAATGSNAPEHELAVTPSVLWPPNHKLVPVRVRLIDNPSDAVLDCKIIKITSSEPAGGDIRITGDLTAKLGAWRDPHGRGRVYTITVRCTDSSGESTTSTLTVVVPKSPGKSKTRR